MSEFYCYVQDNYVEHGLTREEVASMVEETADALLKDARKFEAMAKAIRTNQTDEPDHWIYEGAYLKVEIEPDESEELA